MTKKELGPAARRATPPSASSATACAGRAPDELYNDGQAFKICARDARGVIVTLIADNYFGYCKKEVKTQISYSANLFGNAEEEHAGGALVFASYNLGQEFDGHVGQRRLHARRGARARPRSGSSRQPRGPRRGPRAADIVLVPAGRALLDCAT